MHYISRCVAGILASVGIVYGTGAISQQQAMCSEHDNTLTGAQKAAYMEKIDELLYSNEQEIEYYEVCDQLLPSMTYDKDYANVQQFVKQPGTQALYERFKKLTAQLRDKMYYDEVDGNWYAAPMSAIWYDLQLNAVESMMHFDESVQKILDNPEQQLTYSQAASSVMERAPKWGETNRRVLEDLKCVRNALLDLKKERDAQRQ